MTEKKDTTGREQGPVDPRAADPEAAAREHAERTGLGFEEALDGVRASIAKREAAAARIRAVREQVRATLAEREAPTDAKPDKGSAVSADDDGDD